MKLDYVTVESNIQKMHNELSSAIWSWPIPVQDVKACGGL